MKNSAKAITGNRSCKSILAWPHRGKRISLTEDQVRAKVATTFAAEFKISPGQLVDDAPIKKDLSADFYKLAGPIMIIENFFRTRLQDELARDDLSMNSIVDNLMRRAHVSQSCRTGDDYAYAA